MSGMNGRGKSSHMRFRLPFRVGLLVVDLAAIILLSLFNYRIYFVEGRTSYEQNFMDYERNVTYMAFNNIEKQLISVMEIPDMYFSQVAQNDAMLRPQREDIIGEPEHVKSLIDLLYRIRSSYPYLYSMDIYYENTGTALTGFENLHEVDDLVELNALLPWFSSLDDSLSTQLLPMGVNSYPTSQPVITYVRVIPYASWGNIYVALHILPTAVSAFITEDAIRSFYLSDPDNRLIYAKDDRIGTVLAGALGPEAKTSIDGEDVVLFSYVFPDSGLRYTYLIDFNLFRQLTFSQNRQLTIIFMVSLILNILVLSGLTYLNYIIYRKHIHRFSENAGLPVSGEGIDASLSSMAAQIMNLHHTAESAKELRRINAVRSILLSRMDGSRLYPQVYEKFAGRFVRCCIIESDGREGDLMANMLNEQFRQDNVEGIASVLCTFISPSSVVVLIIVDEELHLLDEMTGKTLSLASDLNVDIGRLAAVDDDGLRESFLSAQEVARYRFLYQTRLLTYDALDLARRRGNGNHVKVVDQLEKDLNSQQTDAFSSHLTTFLDELAHGGYTIQYCLSAVYDIAVAVYGYMLRNQLDTWIVFGYDIREYTKTLGNLELFRDWLVQSVDAIYRALRQRAESVDSDIKQQIGLIINREIENDISLSMLADELGMKPYELSRVFSKIMGKNYIDYIKEKKLMKAVEFLRQGMAVQDIAKRLGYRSPQYFIRIFKENFGTTPYQYRKTVLDSEGEDRQ